LADKLRRTFPIAVTFSQGEVVAPTKMQGFSTETRNAFGIAEYAIGDIWNQAGDSFLRSAGVSTYALMIPNIARYLGSSKLSGPMIPYLDTTQVYSHKVVSSDVGQYEITLSLPAHSLSSFSWSGTSTPSNTPTTRGLMTGLTDWSIDDSTGRVYTNLPAQADWVLTYTPAACGDLSANSTFNIIPDPAQEVSYSFASCKIAYKNNVDNSAGYIIFLPPRGPLDSTRFLDRSPQSPYDASSNTYNMQTDPTSAYTTFWQHFDDSGTPVQAATGDNGEHYRYRLPKVITDNWTFESVLPAGMLYLWDSAGTGTILDGVTFYAEDSSLSPVAPRKYVLVASGAALDAWCTSNVGVAYPADALTSRDTHTPVYYPSTGLKLITIGTSIGDTLSALTKAFLDHDHSDLNGTFPSKPIDHASLKDNFYPQEMAGLLGIATDVWTRPAILNDHHPQYLHRGGYNAAERDRFCNGMLGDIFFLSVNSADNHQNLLGYSYGLRFGDSTNGTRMLYDPIYQGLLLYGNNSTKKTINFYDSTSGKGARIAPVFGTNGAISIEDRSITMGEGRGGIIQANQHYAGHYNHSTYGDSGSTGISPGGWGKPRLWHISANDFSVYNGGINEGDSRAIDSKEVEILSSYGGAAVMMKKTGATQTQAFAYIKIPFVRYLIVNMKMALKSVEGFNVGDLSITLGRENYLDASRPSSEIDVYKDLCRDPIGAPADFSYRFAGESTAWQRTDSHLLFNPEDPVYITGLAEINSDLDTVDPYDLKAPFIHFESQAGAGDFYLAHIYVVYRIWEY